MFENHFKKQTKVVSTCPLVRFVHQLISNWLQSVSHKKSYNLFVNTFSRAHYPLTIPNQKPPFMANLSEQLGGARH